MAFIVALAVAGIVLQGIFICEEHREHYLKADILKGSASLMFVIIGLCGVYFTGLLNLTTNVDASFAKKLFIGLVFGMIGDILLNLRFVLEKIGQKIFLMGILAFLIGHILYLCALIPLASNFWLCAGIGAVLAAGLLAYIFKTMEVKLAFKIFGVVYLGAVIIMTVVAIGIAIASPSPRSVVYAVGAVLFTASDIVLIFNTFSGVTRFPLRITNLSLYYLGQLLIAGSLFMAG